MKRTRKLVTVAVLAVAVVVSAITAAYALSANTTETYASVSYTHLTLPTIA